MASAATASASFGSVPMRRILSRTAISTACAEIAILPSLLLGVVADVIAVALRLPHRVGVHHRGTARNAEEEPTQECPQVVPDRSTLVVAVALKDLVNSIPGVLIDDSVVLARVEDAFVIDHSGVQDVGQGRMQRSSGEWLPAPDLAIFSGPVLAHQTDPLGFLKDRQR
jgi:hypothetical protein